MRVISVKLENFASYKSLEFDYSGQGLTLLRGLTGSGKSTLCDAVPWILFGKTAKGGAVDDVLSWPGDQVTKGTLFLENVTINRSRGPKAKDNDLMFWPVDGVVTRGKDLPDTQRLINSLLGFYYDLYLAGAYYHEFSQTAQFFTTTAKNRRVICEQFVDLSLATKLQPRLAEDKKILSRQLDETKNQVYTLGTNIDLLRRMYMSEVVKYNDWDTTKLKRISLLQDKIVNFEVDKVRIVKALLLQEEDFIKTSKLWHELDCAATTCSACGASKKAVKKEYKPQPNPYTERIVGELDRSNTYIEQMVELEAETNPHLETAQKMSLNRADKELELEQLKLKLSVAENDMNELELLQLVVSDYRSASITNTIQDLEIQTNKLLTDHFDAEIRVGFTVEDADKLDVTIHKDGNACTFTQLSKGQRCLLKLCFGVAVMSAVQNHHGIKFEQIFLDEVLEGCDEIMKVKAYSLLQTLGQEYDSIFISEHSTELKALFTNQVYVQLINGESVISNE